MSYEGLSSLPAGSSGNANEKMGPKGLPADAFGRAVAPAAHVVQERPSYILLNNAGTYKFLYTTTCSIGGTSTAEYYSTGSVLDNDAQTIRLDIQPVAWGSGSAGKVGDVVFVYQSGI